jgi:hypothetical protein
MTANPHLPLGGMCRLAFRNWDEFRLRIMVDAFDVNGKRLEKPMCNALAATVGELAAEDGASVRLCTADEGVDWIVRADGEEVHLVPAAGWGCKDGKVPRELASGAFGPVPVDESLADWLRARFARIARVHNLLELTDPGRNTVDGTESTLDLELHLVRYTGDSTSDFELVEWENGYTVHSGDSVGFQITNNGSRAVDVTLLYIDSAYGIEAHIPHTRYQTKARVYPGESVPSPRGDVEASDLPEHAVLIGVPALLQLVQADFSFLEQERIAPGLVRNTRHSDLERLLESKVFGVGTTRGLPVGSGAGFALRRITWKTIGPDGAGREK